MGMSSYERGAQRDEETIRLITQLRFMTALQVARCLFAGRRRVAARRLHRLVELGLLRSARLKDSAGPLVYFAPPRQFSRAVLEALEVAELRCRLQETRPTAVDLKRFDVEVPLKAVRADAMLLTRSEGRDQVSFVEWDRGTCVLEQVAEKVPAYERYAQSGDYRRTGWWLPGIEVKLVFAVPKPRTEPLSRAISHLDTRLKPLVVDHGTLLANPWSVLIGTQVRFGHQKQFISQRS